MTTFQSSNSQSAMLTAFSDEVTQTQQTFRHLMTAMSEPATIMTLTQYQTVINSSSNDKQQVTQTGHLNKLYAIWALAQTVLDSEVSVFVDMKIHDTLAKSIRFFTGAILVDSPSQADYLIISIADLASLLEHHELNIGTLEKPHTSTTLMVLTDALSNEALSNASLLQITGPGIEDTRQLAITGLTEDIVKHLQDNQQLFPCGIDWVFCAGNQLTALPRTSEVQLMGQGA